MNKILSTAKQTVGFTLIELLVVIGILGILAAALVATIDPFEQLKKANDANVENAEIEFINAVIRYYTIHNAFPWDATGSGGTDCMGINAGAGGNDLGYVNLGSTGAGGFDACLTDLINNGELKASFGDAEGILDKIIVFELDTAVTACYDPESKAKTNDAQTMYIFDDLDTPTTRTDGTATCIGTGNAAGNVETDCYRCTSG